MFENRLPVIWLPLLFMRARSAVPFSKRFPTALKPALLKRPTLHRV